MKVIRVIAVGLFSSAVIMSHLSVDFFREWMTSAPANFFILPMKALAPQVVSGTGIETAAVIVLTFATAGVGLLQSALLYSPLDDFLVGLFRGRPVMSSGSVRGVGSTGSGASTS